jgi:hypothetical protein
MPLLLRRAESQLAQSLEAPNFDAVADFNHGEVRAHFHPPGIGFPCGGHHIIIRRTAKQDHVAIDGKRVSPEITTDRPLTSAMTPPKIFKPTRILFDRLFNG